MALGKGKESAWIKMLHIQIGSVNYGVTHKETTSHMIIAFLHHQFSFINSFQVQNPSEKRNEKLIYSSLFYFVHHAVQAASRNEFFDYFWRSWHHKSFHRGSSLLSIMNVEMCRKYQTVKPKCRRKKSHNPLGVGGSVVQVKLARLSRFLHSRRWRWPQINKNLSD